MVSSWDKLSTKVFLLYERKGKTTKNEKEQIFAYLLKVPIQRLLRQDQSGESPTWIDGRKPQGKVTSPIAHVFDSTRSCHKGLDPQGPW